jgi:uncharacterized protein YbjT (DUF2867 family)
VASQRRPSPPRSPPPSLRLSSDGGEVATRLVELSFGKPSGLVSDIAGPRVYEMKELLRSYLRASHRLILPPLLPGKAARAIRAGANLALEQAAGHRTWEEFLADRVSQQ